MFKQLNDVSICFRGLEMKTFLNAALQKSFRFQVMVLKGVFIWNLRSAWVNDIECLASELNNSPLPISVLPQNQTKGLKEAKMLHDAEGS